MPLLNEIPPPRRPNVVMHPSVAVELVWALAAAERNEYHPDLAAIYGAAPELGARVTTFWGSEVAISCGGFFMELMVLAHHGGLLFSTDAAPLLARLDDLCATSPSDLRLASESDSDRRAIVTRLDRLRSSAALRHDYIQLVTDVWTAVAGVWTAEGRRAVEAAIAGQRELLARGAPWPEVAGGDCDFDGLLPRLVDGLGPSEELAIVPAFFTRGGMLVDLPGVVVVGVRTDQSGAQSRARTELLARRLKSISDPTRLAILDRLSRNPGTVTELASSFGLAQPTVSNHIKLLRDAGLIATDASGRSGTRRQLAVQPEAVADLFEQLQSVLRPHPAPSSSADS